MRSSVNFKKNETRMDNVYASIKLEKNGLIIKMWPKSGYSNLENFSIYNKCLKDLFNIFKPIIHRLFPLINSLKCLFLSRTKS